MKVSVCVVTFNHQDFINDCLLSILEQKTNFDYEIIVGDDCSTDNTVSIIKNIQNLYPNKISLVERKMNIGFSNNEIDIHIKATGEYVCHIDGDDLMLPNKLQMQADFLDNNKEYSLVAHKVKLFNNFEEKNEYNYQNGKLGYKIDASMYISIGTLFAHSALMYRRVYNIYEKFINPNYNNLLDYNFIIEILMHGNGMILNEVLGKYRLHNSLIHKLDRHNLNIRDWENFVLKYPNYKKEIETFFTLNFLAHLKNNIKTYKNYGMLFFRYIRFFNLKFTVKTYKLKNKIQLKTNLR